MQNASDELFRIYCAVWQRAEDDGIWVHYEGTSSGTPAAGGYHPRDDMPGAGPMISISRSYYSSQTKPSRDRNSGAPATLAPPDILAETMTLAHEYGHHRSCVEGNRIKALVDAMIKVERYYAAEDIPPLTDEEKDLIRTEERRAWTIAREILTGLGFTEWEAFDAKEKNDLEQYEVIFRWETLPYHVEVLYSWARAHEKKIATARAFESERTAYYAACDAAISGNAERQVEYERGIWDAERNAIEVVRKEAKGEATQADVVAAVDACIACFKGEAVRLQSLKRS